MQPFSFVRVLVIVVDFFTQRLRTTKLNSRLVSGFGEIPLCLAVFV
jgi:hypothetical protein